LRRMVRTASRRGQGWRRLVPGSKVAGQLGIDEVGAGDSVQRIVNTADDVAPLLCTVGRCCDERKIHNPRGKIHNAPGRQSNARNVLSFPPFFFFLFFLSSKPPARRRPSSATRCRPQAGNLQERHSLPITARHVSRPDHSQSPPAAEETITRPPPGGTYLPAMEKAEGRGQRRRRSDNNKNWLLTPSTKSGRWRSARNATPAAMSSSFQPQRTSARGRHLEERGVWGNRGRTEELHFSTKVYKDKGTG